jgi:predicted signal transduction protein with EAL and GGDEF domain
MRLRLCLLALFAAVALAHFAGWLRPLDDALRDLRFAGDRRDPTGSIVLVEIDSKALDAVGVWPWPRTVHAQVLTRLLELSAAEVAFDIDFSQPSTPAEDKALEAALEDAGGYALLPAFRQLASADGVVNVTVPLPAFAQHAEIVAVNVATDGAGAVRAMPQAIAVGDALIPSLPAALAGSPVAETAEFIIDYGIRVERIDRVSVAELLAGRIDPARIGGRQVVIGASALELRDVMMAPTHGPLPGALIQIVAAESLKQGRALLPVPPWVWLVVLAAAALIVTMLGRRLAMPPGLAVLAAIVGGAELSAFLLQRGDALLLDTAGLELALAASLVVALAAEAVERRRLHREAVRQRIEVLETLADRARHDPLTGALTRQEFCARLDAAIRPGAPVVIFRLTRYGKVSEALGHAVGERLLEQAVGRVRAALGGEIARIAGETFAVCPTSWASGESVEDVCRRIRDAVTAPYRVDGHQAIVGCTIGAVQAEPGVTAATLLTRAEMARSAAALSPAHAYVAYEPSMEARIASTRALELALREAIANHEIEVHYQGLFDLRTGELVGAEALSRWTHPVLGAVSPLRFFALAEETGLAVELGAQVMEQACRKAASWPTGMQVSVNISPSQFELDDVIALVRCCLEKSGLAPGRLMLEITEGLLLTASSAVLETLERLRQMGIGIAIDDFGTGYSSLSYLGTLPVDKVKLDRSFVRKLMTDGRSEAITEAILALCHRLGFAVVAEGVETAAQAEWLKARGCEFGQGYLFHRPESAAAFRALADRRASSAA